MNITLCIVVASVAIAILIYLYFRKDKKKDKESLNVDDVKMPQPSPPSPEMVLFFSHSCSHCKNMMPAWMQFKQLLTEKKAPLRITEKDSVDYSLEGIPGFPTVRFYPTGYQPGSKNFVAYQGDRSVQSFIEFTLKSMGVPQPPQPSPLPQAPQPQQQVVQEHYSPPQAPQQQEPQDGVIHGYSRL